MEARCQCGQITFSTPGPVPHRVYICHCTECRHQSSSAFSVSAVFPLFDIADLVSLPGFGEYTRFGLSGRTVHCYFCRNCGAMLIHRVDGNAHLTVKAGCFAVLTREMLQGAVHVWTNHAVVDIPSDVVQFAEGPLDDARKEHAKVDVRGPLVAQLLTVSRYASTNRVNKLLLSQLESSVAKSLLRSS